jgi:hypothetical protein
MNAPAQAPVRQLTLYRHGVARWLRHARFEGDTLTLTVAADDVDTLLKSCTLHPAPGTDSRLLSIAHARKWVRPGAALPGLSPQDGRAALLRAWQGHEVVVEHAGQRRQGRVAGLEAATETEPQRLLLCEDDGTLRSLPLSALESLRPVEPAQARRLDTALQRLQRPDGTQMLRLRLNPGRHDLALTGLVPCAPWRVSYRAHLGEADAHGRLPVRLQAWAVVDNPFAEDLENVALELVTGRPLAASGSLLADDPAARLGIGRLHHLERPQVSHFDPMFTPAIENVAPEDPDASAYTEWEPASLPTDTSRPVEMGTLEGHAVAEPLTLPAACSAMVPLFEQALEGEVELLALDDRACRTLRLVHPGPGALEPGPLSVSDAAGHCGGSEVLATPAGSPLSLPFAEATGLTLRTQVQSEDSALRWRLGAQAQLCLMSRETCKTWTVENRTRQDERLVFEADDPIDGSEWLPPALPERRWGRLRWTLDCPAGQRAVLVVRRRQVLQRQLLRPAKAEELARWLQPGADEALDDAGQRPAAEALLPLLREDARLEQALAAQGDALAALLARQLELRKTVVALGPAGEDGEEAALRLQLVRELAETTTETGSRRRQQAALQAERHTLAQRLAAAWAALEPTPR